MDMKKRGRIFVITGPSGVGKTEIAKNILKDKKLNIKRVVTCTTRAPREGEINGKDYFFLTKQEFLNNIKNNNMFEHSEHYGSYYGSRKKDVEALLETGNNVLFLVDVKGALTLKKINPECNIIFINAESKEELRKRLINRKTDSEEGLSSRIKAAMDELKLADKFDYIIINKHGKIEEAIKEVADIILRKDKKIILIEGLPGTGKSTLIDKLNNKYLVVFEFHTKRKKITKEFGAFNKNKRVSIGNKKVKILEDKLENIILNSRFINPNKGNLKLNLLKEKLNECLGLKENIVFKEGFFGCLIDKNSKEFLEELKILLKKVDTIVFLKLSEKELRNRQIQRLGDRKGEYDDTTSKARHKLFMNQFRFVTKNKKVLYLDASKSKKEIIRDLEKKLGI